MTTMRMSMIRTICICLLVHCHAPCGLFARQQEWAAFRSYLPFIALFARAGLLLTSPLEGANLTILSKFFKQNLVKTSTSSTNKYTGQVTYFTANRTNNFMGNFQWFLKRKSENAFVCPNHSDRICKLLGSPGFGNWEYNYTNYDAVAVFIWPSASAFHLDASVAWSWQGQVRFAADGLYCGFTSRSPRRCPWQPGQLECGLWNGPGHAD